MPGPPLKVAVLGASGIGKHHAKWYRSAGCDVVAFLGSSRASCEATASKLREMIGFDGRAYHDVDALLDGEAVDAVSVCSPDPLHAQHALAALARGVHVLCEKPLVWLDGAPHEQAPDAAERVVTEARQRFLVLAVNTQYVAALPFYFDLYRQARGEVGRVESFFCATTSVLRRPTDAFETVWRDLAPHPISLLLAALPDGRLDEGSVDCCIGPTGSEARFDWLLPGGPCRCRLVVGKVAVDEIQRSFGINDYIVHYTGRSGPDGVFCTYLRPDGADRETVHPDLMRLSVEAFVNAVRGRGRVVTDGRAGLRNLRLQVRLMELGGRARRLIAARDAPAP